MAYPRNCIHCGQLIVMSELSPGRWQPWEPDGSSRHSCGSGQTKAIKPPLSLIATISNAETYLTRCPWCRQHVHYHTNGYGDCVYFDNLGYPWQVHACWEKHWKEKKDRQRILEQLSNRSTCDRQKLQILAGVLRGVNKSGSEEQPLYAIHEITVAQRLGISVTRLKTDYGHLYQPEAHGIRLKVQSSPQIVPIVTNVITSSIRANLLECRRCGKLVWESRLISHLRTSHPLATTQCPNCPKLIPTRSLQEHLETCKPQKQRKKGSRNKGNQATTKFRRC